MNFTVKLIILKYLGNTKRMLSKSLLLKNLYLFLVLSEGLKRSQLMDQMKKNTICLLKVEKISVLIKESNKYSSLSIVYSKKILLVNQGTYTLRLLT
jgi:hypothetical protein